MSVENVRKYGQLCAENEEVRKKAKEIGIKDLNGQIAYAKTLGLEFSREDIEALVKETGLDGQNELSDEDLEKVAGGRTSITPSTASLVAELAAVSAATAAKGYAVNPGSY
jgi:predicted ribosomally synthesized peptide with nif11-like leader